MTVRLNCCILLALMFLALISSKIWAQPSTEIIMKSNDHGFLTHIEYVPMLKYTHLSLTASEVAKELLVKALQGDVLDQQIIDFLLRCYRDGYFASDPASYEPDFMSTFYATWLFKVIGVEKRLNESFLVDALCGAEDFPTAFYAARTLEFLGHELYRDCFRDWDLGYAVSYIRNSTAPDIESTKLWLLIFPEDEAKKEWLRNKGIYVYPEASVESLVKDWYGIEQLIIFRPVFINATVYPRVVVSQEPKLVSAKAVRFPNEPVEVYFSWRVEENKIVSFVYADGRLLNFTHLVGRQEYALLIIDQKLGSLSISCSYKPSYKLRIRIAGVEYEWNVDSYDFNETIELPAYGVFNLESEIEREDVLLRGKGTIDLRTSYEVKLLDYAFMILPTVNLAVALAGTRKKRRKAALTACYLIALTIPLVIDWDFILGLHPLWLTLGYGTLLLALTYLIERKAFYRCLSHIMILIALTSTAMIMGNPLILLLGGFGAGLFLISAVIYPSEMDKTERFYKSIMLIYSLGVLAMAVLNEVSVSIAATLYAPDSGFIDAIRVQAMFIANLFALMPVVASLYHLARLIHVYERAKEARELLKSMI